MHRLWQTAAGGSSYCTANGPRHTCLQKGLQGLAASRLGFEQQLGAQACLQPQHRMIVMLVLWPA